MFDPKKKAVDWAVYRHGGKWRLFTLACLVHRLDPRAVLDDAYLAIRKHGGPSSEVLNDPKAAAAMLYDVPEMYLIEPVGATLERMKTATGLPDAGAIACEQARALADSLGLTFPAELMPTLRQQPAPQAEAPAVGASGSESKEQRQARRHRACIDAKLKLPTDDYSHLPRGIGELAKAEGITRQAFAEDVKAHIRRLNGK